MRMIWIIVVAIILAAVIIVPQVDEDRFFEMFDFGDPTPPETINNLANGSPQ